MGHSIAHTGANAWRVFIDGNLKLSYTQPNGKAWIDAVGPGWWYNGRTGAGSVDILLRNISVTGVYNV